jgi:four helix bundle protein
MNKPMQKSNLNDLTLNFSKTIIRLIKSLPLTIINSNICSQLIRSSTSIGANYCEAIESESRNDFIHKCAIAKKEANETIYWLKLLVDIHPDHGNIINQLILDSEELIRIFGASIATSKRNLKNS